MTLPPELLNKRNRLLAEQLNALEKQVDAGKAKLRLESNQLQIFNGHVVDTTEQVKHYNALVIARQKQEQTERSECEVVARNVSKIKMDCRDKIQEANSLNEKVAQLQPRILLAHQALQRKREQLQLGEEQLEQWLATKQAQAATEDAVANELRGFHQTQLRNLTRQAEVLQSQVRAIEAQVISAENEGVVIRAEVEGVLRQSNALRQERAQMIGQWEAAVHTLQKREAAFLRMAELLNRCRGECERKEETLNAQRQMLSRVLAEITEVTSKTDAAERHRVSLHDRVQRETAVLNEMESEIETARAALTASAVQLNRWRGHAKAQKQQLEDRLGRLQQLETDAKRKEASLQALLGQGREVKNMDGVLLEHLKALEARNNELTTLLDPILLRSRHEMTQELKGHQDARSTLEMNVAATRKAIGAMRSRAIKIETESSSLEEQEQRLVRECARMETRKTRAQQALSLTDGNDGDAKEEKRYLEEQLDRIVEEWKALRAACEEATNAARASKRANVACEGNVKELTESNDILRVEIANLEKSSAAAIQQIKTNIALVDAQRAKVMQLERICEEDSAGILQVQDRQNEAMNELQWRMNESDAHLQSLMTKIRDSEMEIKQIAQKIADMGMVYHQLRDRHQRKINDLKNVVRDIAPTLSETLLDDHILEDASHLHSIYLLCLSQERASLQERGDWLDDQIVKMTDEMAKLEQSAGLLAEANAALFAETRRAQFHHEPDSSDLNGTGETAGKTLPVLNSISSVDLALHLMGNLLLAVAERDPGLFFCFRRVLDRHGMLVDSCGKLSFPPTTMGISTSANVSPPPSDRVQPCNVKLAWPDLTNNIGVVPSDSKPTPQLIQRTFAKGSNPSFGPAATSQPSSAPSFKVVNLCFEPSGSGATKRPSSAVISKPQATTKPARGFGSVKVVAAGKSNRMPQSGKL